MNKIEKIQLLICTLHLFTSISPHAKMSSHSETLKWMYGRADTINMTNITKSIFAGNYRFFVQLTWKRGADIISPWIIILMNRNNLVTGSVEC